jgi:hypothetical protein
MYALDYTDENVIKEELQKLVFQEMTTTFDSLNRVQAEFEALAVTLEGAEKDQVGEKIGSIKDSKLEMITKFKAMSDFLA